ncbi:MAG: MFS transporter [Sphingomonadaceae bacterium]|jgi:MFS transporter, Spinster family, sphingosine-1-phosphate transporter|nr:MFS transporter [Sphingomonadaceae bacterium]NBU77606.1 MFS transporter [Sphingomonadaceae bacterium]NCA02317.1 MFS transporter [Sphingomonadaceae bacterium]
MSAQSAEASPNVRLLMWTLLIVYIFNFLDRQIVNILAEEISRDLNLSDAQIGLMTGLAFALFYTFLGIPIARYVDRPKTNRAHVITISLGVWSAMTAACGLAQNFVQLLLARIGVGVGEAGCTPAAHSLITDAVPAEKRASAMAFYGLGIPIGGLIGMVIGGTLNDFFGWRNAFLAVSIPGILFAFVLPFSLRDPGRHHLVAKAAPQQRFGTVLRQIMTNKSFVLVLLGASFTAFLSYGKGVWVVILFQRDFGLSAGQTGLWLGVITGLAGMLGTWGGGYLADRFGKADKRHILTAPALGMTLAAPLLFAAYVMQDWRLCLVLLIIPTTLNYFYYGPSYALAQQLVRPDQRAVATSLVIFGQNLIGLGLGPLFFGILSDAFKPMAGAESVRWVLYGAAWLGLVPAWFFWRASKRLKQDLPAA